MMIRKILNRFPRVKKVLKKIITLFSGFHMPKSKKKPLNVWFDTHKMKNTVLLLGSPRSGTTWVSNLLNHTNIFRYIFEPFREDIIEMGVLGSQPYVVYPEVENAEIIAAMRIILSGKLKQISWLTHFNKRRIASRFV